VLENIKREYLQLLRPFGIQKVHIACALCGHLGLKGIYIAYNEMQARKMFEDVSFFFGKDAVFFPSKEIMLHDVEAKSYDSIYERINALYRIVNDDYGL